KLNFVWSGKSIGRHRPYASSSGKALAGADPQEESSRADQRAQQAYPDPSELGVDQGGGRCSARAADRIEDHVTRGQAAAGLRTQAKDQALVGHMDRLQSEIQGNDASEQPPQ